MFFTKTVDGVMKKFIKAIDDLDGIAADQLQAQNNIMNKLTLLHADLDDARVEQERAEKAATKLRALVS